MTKRASKTGILSPVDAVMAGGPENTSVHSSRDSSVGRGPLTSLEQLIGRVELEERLMKQAHEDSLRFIPNWLSRRAARIGLSGVIPAAAYPWNLAARWFFFYVVDDRKS